MEKIWYIIINEKEKGPFSLEDLILNKHFTAETLTRKEGTLTWRPAREFPEFNELFAEHSDDGNQEPEKELNKEELPLQDNEIALDWRKRPIDPFFFFLIFILIVLLFIYLFDGLQS